VGGIALAGLLAGLAPAAAQIAPQTGAGAGALAEAQSAARAGAATAARIAADARSADRAGSGALELWLHDSTLEEQADGQLWLVLRYLAPALEGGALGYGDVAAEMDALCEADGLAALAASGPVDQILIVLMDRPVPRGTADPEATMYISAYRAEAGRCLWQ